MKLNLGAGNRPPIEGFEDRDGAKGDVLFPLPDADESVEEIRASHVLEHFPYWQIGAVMKDWVRVLKPGGLIRIAVPDFEKIARDYLDGKDFNIQGYVFGGQKDERDLHRCGFDAETLAELFLDAGLERVHRWASELADDASLAISLNLGAYKPSGPAKVCEGTTAVLSAPRFGPVMHMRCAFSAFGRARVPYQIAQGAYWHQIMSEVLEGQLVDETIKYVITCDFDTVFRHEEVMELYRLMESCPEADAIFPLQSKRASDYAILGILDDHGAPVTSITGEKLSRSLLQVSTGHFGLTIFRAERLRSFARPWMVPLPNKEGRWTDGKTDADIDFWHRWKASGRTLYLAPRVVVGHLQELVTWPGRDLKPIYQTTMDFDATGIPEAARR